MKSEKGVTLASLIVYILVFSIVLGALASMSNFIYGNLGEINGGSYSSEEFNKFNVNFVKDVKNNYNANIYSNNDNIKIVFEDGVNYDYVKNEKALYRNKVKIAEKIIDFQIQNVILNNKKVLQVNISTGQNAVDFNQKMKYVLKYW